MFIHRVTYISNGMSFDDNDIEITCHYESITYARSFFGRARDEYYADSCSGPWDEYETTWSFVGFLPPGETFVHYDINDDLRHIWRYLRYHITTWFDTIRPR